MIDDWKAVLAGAFVGGVLAGLWAVQKGRELERRGNQLAAALEQGGTEMEAYLLTQGESTEATLSRLGQEEAERVAEQAADQYMGDVYGLTPERIVAIQRLGQRLSF